MKFLPYVALWLFMLFLCWMTGQWTYYECIEKGKSRMIYSTKWIKCEKLRDNK